MLKNVRISLLYLDVRVINKKRQKLEVKQRLLQHANTRVINIIIIMINEFHRDASLKQNFRVDCTNDFHQ